jgi:hypothetical protein
MKKILSVLFCFALICASHTDCADPFAVQMSDAKVKSSTNDPFAGNPSSNTNQSQMGVVSKNQKQDDDPFAKGGDVGDGDHGEKFIEAWPYTFLSYYEIFWIGVVLAWVVGITQSVYTYKLWND